MIGPVAMATSNIRVGSGGVMLPHYSPLKVAENFSMLQGLNPGRIDLGIGRAPGTSARVAAALQRDRRLPPVDDFLEQLDELIGYLSPATIVSGPLRQMPVMRFEAVEISLLGSSPQSAVWAAQLGLPYVFADFINPEGAPMAALYREQFRPSATLEKPRVSVAVWAIAAETTEEAIRLSASARMMMLLMFRGQLIQVPPVEKALEFLKREGMPIDSLPQRRRIIAGDPETVQRSIENVAAEYGADEVFVVNIMYDHGARMRCYELIARAFGD
jgi:luciferase family oxidoreductase group 1